MKDADRVRVVDMWRPALILAALGLAGCSKPSVPSVAVAESKAAPADPNDRPTVLARPAGYIQALAVDDSWVYFAEHDRVGDAWVDVVKRIR